MLPFRLNSITHLSRGYLSGGCIQPALYCNAVIHLQHHQKQQFSILSARRFKANNPLYQQKLGGRTFDAIKSSLSQNLLNLKHPPELLITLSYCIPVLFTIRICVETGIFKKLASAAEKGEDGVSATDLAKAMISFTSGESSTPDKEQESFIVRTLRPLCALEFVDEISPGVYSANDITKSMADDDLMAGYLYMYENTFGPKSSITELLSYSRDRGWRGPPTADEGAYQQARGLKDISTFKYFTQKEPLQLSRLSAYMQAVQREREHWTAWFPGDHLKLANQSSNEKVTFVDVGGGYGHDLSALASRYPSANVQFILEDLPMVLKEATQGKTLDSRIKTQEHDFFTPQPIPNADFYYMHKIIHDWPDYECVKILSHLRDVMGPDSSLLINDMILPAKGCPLLPAAFDITMLALHSGKERDEAMWTDLIEQVGGLEIKKFWYPPGEGEGIVEVVKTKR